MAELELADLVANGTMSDDIAATLRATVRERHSFVVFAVPRLAGKTTVLNAMLEARPSGTPVVTVTGEPEEQRRLQAEPQGGYLYVPEIANSGVPGYLWGEPVQRVFRTLAAGYSLAVALHAPNVGEAFRIISKENSIPDDEASKVRLAVYIRSIGEWRTPTARRVSEVHEVARVVGGVPEVTLLHRWDEKADRFLNVDGPRTIGAAQSR